MSNKADDKLKELFQKMTWDEPSNDFESRLMARIVATDQKTQKRDRCIYLISLIASGVVLLCIATISLIAIGVDFSKLSHCLTNRILGIKPAYLSILISTFFLLIINALIRANLYKKEK